MLTEPVITKIKVIITGAYPNTLSPKPPSVRYAVLNESIKVSSIGCGYSGGEQALVTLLITLPFNMYVSQRLSTPSGAPVSATDKLSLSLCLPFINSK